MWKLPKEYRDKEILWRRLILFTLSLGLILFYFPQILGLIGTAIWVLLPFIIGGILAFALTTLSNVLLRVVSTFITIEKNQKTLMLFRILTVILVLMFIGLFLAFVVPSLITSAQRIAAEFPMKIDQLVARVYQKTAGIPLIHDWMDKNSDLFSDIPGLLERVFSFITTGSAGSAFENVRIVISNTFSWIWILFLSVVFSFIAFFNSSHFVQEGRMIAKAYLPAWVYEKLRLLVGLISKTFSQYLGGTVIECIILASLTSVFGLIFGIPNAVLAGVICGVCALVPMFGATAGAVLCTLFILMDSPGKALTFLIMFICIQQVEGNFIYPVVVGKKVGLPSMYVVVAITVGASVAGVLGMILSIPVFSIVYELITSHARKRLEETETAKEIKPAVQPADQQDSK